MGYEHVLFSLSLGLHMASGTPLKGQPKPLSLPLHRPFSPYKSEDVQGPLPLSVNGIESLVYTVDVQVGSQRFNLTLDTNAQASVLFAKGFVALNRSCSTGYAQRNLFDPGLSKTLQVAAGSVGGWYLYEYPYVGLECHESIGSGMDLYGMRVQDTYQLGALSVPEVPFILSNFTFYPLNPRWASDGILPLGYNYLEALPKVLSSSGGAQEVSLFLNNAKTTDNHPVPGGRITFGGKNTRDCGDKWVTLQSDFEADWSLALNSVTVGTRSITSGEKAELSTSSPFLEVPLWDFRPVVNAMGGAFNDDLDLYTVDCNKIDSLPPITISLGSGFALVYDVKAQDYVAKISGNNGVQCALLIVQGDDGWVVGTQFLPRRCVHLDYASGQVGFADPKNK